MPDLERELRELGGAVAFPATPDVATAVRRRLAAERAPERPFRFRRPLLVAVAVLAVAVGAVMAVPQARTAILEWLGLRGVTIERVETAPTVTRTVEEVDELDLGERVSLAEARRRAAYPVVVPPRTLGEPDAVYFDARIPGGQVAFTYVDGDDVRLLVSEFRARLDEAVIHKVAGPGTRVEPLRVRGEPGWWLEGQPHEFAYVDRETGEIRVETLRLAGDTLLWQRGQLTLRLEGSLSREEALSIAEGVG
jgi:hypothetical protein